MNLKLIPAAILAVIGLSATASAQCYGPSLHFGGPRFHVHVPLPVPHFHHHHRHCDEPRYYAPRRHGHRHGRRRC